MADLDALRAAGEALGALEDAELLDGVERALRTWEGETGRAAFAARRLGEESGSSVAMLRFGLERLLTAHRPPAIREWLSEAKVEAARELAARHPSGEPPSLETLRGPRLVAQVLAGNVAGLALPASLEALLARSAVVLKPARGDRITASLWRESLLEAAPVLGRAVEVESWEGGDRAVEDPLFAQVDLVVASGGAEATGALGRRLGSKVLLYGPRFAVGVVGMAWMQAPESWWDALTREITLWEQRGCLSPRILFVAGNRSRFGQRLGEAMQRREGIWPAPPRSAGEASAVHSFRAPYDLADPKGAGWIGPPTTAWTVAWDEDPSLDAGPPSRVVRITARPPSRILAARLREHRGRIQGLGYAHAGAHARSWRRAAQDGDVPRVAPLETLQDPPAGWRADGRSGLVELLVRGSASRKESP